MDKMREEFGKWYHGEPAGYAPFDVWQAAWQAARQPQERGEAVATFSDATVLPDGSAFAVGSLPLPKDHWLYAPRGEWDNERDEYAECPRPILTHESRGAVVAAVRYAIRGATMCGKENDFDPDAMVLNAVYALCGPFRGGPTHDAGRVAELEAQCNHLASALAESTEQLTASREREERMREALEAMLEIHGVTQRYADTHIEIPQSWVEVSEMARAALAADKEKNK